MSFRDQLEGAFPVQIGDHELQATHVAVLFAAAILIGAGAGAYLSSNGVNVVPKPQPDFEFPNGTNETTVSNANTLLKSHNATLSDQSYTLILDRTQTVKNKTQNSSRVFEYDPANERLLVTNNDPGSTFVMYSSNETNTFGKYIIGNQTRFSQRSSESFAAYTGLDLLGQRMSVLKFDFASVTEFDGQKVARYNITGVDAGSGADPAKYNVSGYVFITEDGVVRKMVIDIFNKEANATIHEEMTFVKLGETSVNQPGWVDKARNETIPPSEKKAQNGSSENSTPTETESTPTETK